MLNWIFFFKEQNSYFFIAFLTTQNPIWIFIVILTHKVISLKTIRLKTVQASFATSRHKQMQSKHAMYTKITTTQWLIIDLQSCLRIQNRVCNFAQIAKLTLVLNLTSLEIEKAVILYINS
mgnify:CR=1 FL=1